MQIETTKKVVIEIMKDGEFFMVFENNDYRDDLDYFESKDDALQALREEGYNL